MEMPKPAEAHKKLEMLAGEWVGEETLHPSPWDPKGGPATGRVHNHAGLDGFAIIQDYQQERGGHVTYRGHGVFGWNAFTKQYTLHWFDSMGYPANVFTGDFPGNTLTLTFLGQQGHTRAIFEFGDADRYTHRMEVSGDGTNWQPFMDGTYTRRK